MVTFNERRAPTSKTNVAEQGIVIRNWSKKFPAFRLHSSLFALEKQPKNLKFEFRLPLIDPLLATFNERGAPTSRKYVAKQCIVMQNWSKLFQTFRSHPSIFYLKRQPKIQIFQSFFISNRPFGGYFQWNVCTDFQKICSWTRYSDVKSIKNISDF